MELDFSRNLDYVWALLPEIILCVWGMVVLVAGVSGKHRLATGSAAKGDPAVGAPTDLGWIALVGVLVAAGANGWLYGVHELNRNGMVAVDGLARFGNWVFLLAAALTILISFGYVVRQRLQAGEFYGLVLFATAGMMIMAAARDLIVIFLGLEVMSISVYALTAFNRRDRKSAEAGLKYFLLGAFSTGFLLYGIALVYGATGSTNVVRIASAAMSAPWSSAILAAGIAFLAVGFAFKVSAVPFHMWTPDVYEGAPAPVTAFMSAGVKAAAFVAFIRVFLVGFNADYSTWYPILWWLAAITMVAANMIALVQTNVKRMLAYSSIAHAGYLLVALSAGNATATAGMLFYLLVYTLMNVGAFAIVITVGRQGEERQQIEDYAGFGWSQPFLGVVLTVFLLSLAGFPGTAGFMGKIYLLQGAADSREWVLSVILVMATLTSYWYYLRVAWFMWMREPASERAHDGIMAPIPMRIALVVSVALIVYLGIFPSSALQLAHMSVHGLGAPSAGVLSVGP